MNTARRVLPVLALAGISILGLSLLAYHARADNTAVGVPSPDRGRLIAPGGQATVSNAVTRTADQMTSDSALKSPVSNSSILFRPTMPLEQYRSLKSAAAGRAAAQSGGRNGGLRTASPAALTPIIGAANFTGAAQGDNGVSSFPPDTHGAVSSSQLVETTNASVEVFSKAGALLSSFAHNAFVGSAAPLGDARVLYDSTWNRWVILIDDFSTCFSGTGTPSFFLAVSTGSDATGPFFIYPVGLGFAPGACFDFPQLGMDQDAVIITANLFGFASPPAVAFGIAKARLYNGLGFGVPVFTGLVATLAPPILQGAGAFDQNGADFLAAAPNGSGILDIYTMLDPERPNKTTLAGPAGITVAPYSIPPNAPQPGCPGSANLLDTSDNRFANACTQTPNGHLFCAHGTGDFGLATPRFYEIDPTGLTIVQSSDFFFSSSSYDFNPSIQANQSGDVS